MEHTCEKLVYTKSIFMSERHWNPCGKPAKVEHKGKHYCGIHNPAKRIERQRKYYEESAKRMAKWTARWRLEQAAPDLLAALKGIYAGTVSTGIEDRVNINASVEAFKAMEAAIAKAEGR